MTVNEEIQRVLNRRNLKAEDKRKTVDQIKGAALKMHADTLVNKEFVEGDLKIKILQPPEIVDNQIIVWASAERNGKPIDFPPGAMPLIFVNPPINVRAEDGNPVENPMKALRLMLADVINRQFS